MRLRGRGLDPEAGANVVGFAGATARGLRFDGDALVVRVPADAGSGPVIVTNGRGTSDPFGAFVYLGLGEPRRRAIGARRELLHLPSAVHGVGDDVFLHSALYGGLVKASDGAFETPGAVLSAAAPWKGALYFTALDAGRAGRRRCTASSPRPARRAAPSRCRSRRRRSSRCAASTRSSPSAPTTEASRPSPRGISTR